MKRNEIQTERKSQLITYLMWGLGFVGISGMHRLYLGQYGRGLALMLTFGGFGIWQLLDIASINERIAILNGEKAAHKSELKGKQVEERGKADNGELKEEISTSIALSEFDDLEAEQAELEKKLKKFKD